MPDGKRKGEPWEYWMCFLGLILIPFMMYVAYKEWNVDLNSAWWGVLFYVLFFLGWAVFNKK